MYNYVEGKNRIIILLSISCFLCILSLMGRIKAKGNYKSKIYFGSISNMDRKGNCLDNGCAENFFGILKSELYYPKEKEYKNIEELEKDIIEYINYYNNSRIKSKLKGMSPVQYRKHSLLVAS